MNSVKSFLILAIGAVMLFPGACGLFYGLLFLFPAPDIPRGELYGLELIFLCWGIDLSCVGLRALSSYAQSRQVWILTLATRWIAVVVTVIVVIVLIATLLPMPDNTGINHYAAGLMFMLLNFGLPLLFAMMPDFRLLKTPE